MSTIRNKEYLEVQWLRAIAVVLLVTWHCFFCPMFVWGVVEPGPEVVPFRYLARFLINDAVMPLFTFVSGYLFYALYSEKEKYHDFKPFLWSKTKRLIIPFLVFSPLIILTSYNLYFEEIIWGEGTHMWYCPMLFWCFIIAWALLRIDNKVLILVFFSASTLLVLAYPNFWNLPFRLPLGIDNGIYYFSYFFVGSGVFKYRRQIYIRFKKYIWLLIAVYVVLWLIHCSSIHYISRFAASIKFYLFIVLLWLIVMRLIEKSYLNYSKKLNKLCACSFGIYVFHHWLAWDLVWWPPFSSFLQNNFIWVPFLITPIIFWVSYYIAKLLLKTRIGKFLLA